MPSQSQTSEKEVFVGYTIGRSAKRTLCLVSCTPITVTERLKNYATLQDK